MCPLIDLFSHSGPDGGGRGGTLSPHKDFIIWYSFKYSIK